MVLRSWAEMNEETCKDLAVHATAPNHMLAGSDVF